MRRWKVSYRIWAVLLCSIGMALMLIGFPVPDRIGWAVFATGLALNIYGVTWLDNLVKCGL